MALENGAVGFLNGLAGKPQYQRDGDYECDGILVCGKCGQPRQAWIDWFPDEDGNQTQKLVPILCACDVEREQKEKDRIAQMDYDDAMRKIRLALHTQRDDVRWRFDMDDDPGSPIARTCRKYAAEWDDMRKNNMGILFYGNKGVGKTFYAASICNELKKRRVVYGFTSVPNLMNALSAWDKTEIFDALTRAHLLVLDDLGAERNSDYAAEQIYAVIDARYKTGRPTIVTTNLDIEDMKNEGDILRGRIFDRVLEMCPITLKMQGQSRRGAIADERRRKARELLDWTKKGAAE